MVINNIQETCILLFLINCLANYYIFYFKKIIFLITINSLFLYFEVWFTDQNSKTLEVEDTINNTLVIN